MTIRTMGWSAAVAAVGVCLGLGIEAAGPSDAVVKRGEYLVTVGGCNDCHTPLKAGALEPDMTRMLSGHPATAVLPKAPIPSGQWIAAFDATGTAFAGPWGVSYTRNLTPDKETGLGDWTEQQFIETLRNGRHQGRGRELLPPMPWFNYAKMTDDDLKAVFAYLRSIPAISNKVPDPIIAMPPGQ
jgi:mono/diheme cytochrome c family protein